MMEIDDNQVVNRGFVSKVPTIRVSNLGNGVLRQSIEDNDYGGWVFMDDVLIVVSWNMSFDVGSIKYRKIDDNRCNEKINDGIADTFKVWHSRHGSYYFRDGGIPTRTLNEWRSVDDCINHAFRESRLDIRVESKFLSNKDYRVVSWNMPDNSMLMIFSYFDDRGNMRNLVVEESNIASNDNMCIDSIHHTNPIFIMNSRLYTFDKLRGGLTYVMKIEMKYGMLFGDYLIQSHISELNTLINYIPLSLVIQGNIAGKMKVLRVGERGRHYRPRVSMHYPGLLFMINRENIYVINLRMEIILIMNIYRDIDDHQYNFDFIFDGYVVASSFHKDIVKNDHYYASSYIPIPLSRSNWKVERLIWLGMIKGGTDNHSLSLLPKELIRLIIGYTREWRYAPQLLHTI